MSWKLAFQEEERQARQLAKERQVIMISRRDNLYFNFRYRKDSYKARKMGLQPILMMAKRGKDQIRVYGEANDEVTPKKLAFATARFRAWGQKERELKRLTKKGMRKAR